MVYSGYTKQRILYLRRMGKTYTQIVASLGKEGHSVTKAGISYFLKTYKKTGSIPRQPGSGGKEKKTEAVLKFVDSVMEKDDETSLADLKSQLQKEGTSVSTSTVHRWRQDLRWTSKGTKYCQMI